MIRQNAPNPEAIDPEESTAAKAIEPGFNAVLKVNRTVRNLILDYALAAALLGLIPNYGNKWADLLGIAALGLLNLKLIRDIGRRWGNPPVRDVLASIGGLLGVLGAFAIAIASRVIVSTISLFIPLAIVLSSPVGHGVLTWALGRTANQYYLSIARTNAKTLQKLLQMQCSRDL